MTAAYFKLILAIAPTELISISCYIYQMMYSTKAASAV